MVEDNKEKLLNDVPTEKQVKLGGKTRIFGDDADVNIRILFLGNSITLHGPAPELGWSGDWGMAASTKENDYVHKVLSNLSQKIESNSQQSTCNLVQSITANVEQKSSDNIRQKDAENGTQKSTDNTQQKSTDNIQQKSADKTQQITAKIAYCICQCSDWERSFMNENVLVPYELARDFNADIVVIRLGDNIQPENAEMYDLKKSFCSFIDYFSVNAKKIIVTDLFWKHTMIDGILQNAAMEKGCDFVSINDLGFIKEMKAEGQFKSAGVSLHPSDRGMSIIAERIFGAIVK